MGVAARAARPRVPVVFAVMAKVPVAGEVKTRLCPPLAYADAAQLARCFLLDRLDQLQAVPRSDRLVAFAPAEREAELRRVVPAGVRLVAQQGADLGARLDRLLTDLLAEGYVGALAVDADSPTLPSAYLEEARRRLLADPVDAVVGPTEDGGYYLIGLRAPAPGLFAAMPWSTARVTPETVARAGRLGLRLALLPPWFDVDRAEDLERLRAAGERSDAHAPARTRAFLDELCGRQGAGA